VMAVAPDGRLVVLSREAKFARSWKGIKTETLDSKLTLEGFQYE
jgi:hypothetical protein